MTFHLAQVNIARAKAPLDSPLMAGFVDGLAEMNALADHSPGFIWRLMTDGGDATAVRAYDDPRIIFNLSVWASVDALKTYAYRTEHAKFFARRDEWFEKTPTAHLALWWITAGTIPTVGDATSRLAHLATHGPTAHAFTFRNPFVAPAEP